MKQIDSYKKFPNEYTGRESNSHVIFKNGKIGWEKDGRIIIEPKYDEVEPWGLGLYEVKETSENPDGGRILYLNEMGEEKLTFRRPVVIEEDEYPFSLCAYQIGVLTVVECPPSKNLPESNIIYYNGLTIDIDRFYTSDIVNELINKKYLLPLSRKDLGKLTDKFSYEFVAYRFTVKGEAPLDEIIELFERLYINNNTWFYVMRFTTAVGEHISTAQINRFTQYLDNMDNQTLGRAFAFGTDHKLQPGEVSLLLITHYHECCFPSRIQYELVDVTCKGTLDELMSKDEELQRYTNEHVRKELQEDFLQDSYDTAIGNFGYCPERSWEDSRMVLDYLSSKSDAFMDTLIPLCKKIISRSGDVPSDHEKEYLLGYLSWLVSKGDNVNAIIKGKTVLDLIDHAIHNNKQADGELLQKVKEILLVAGASKYNDFKQEYIATQGEYAFALYLLRQQTHISGKVLGSLD